MAKVWLQDIDGGQAALFDCPGCGFLHAVHISQGHTPRPVWGWNGNVDAPTFTPSIAVSWHERNIPKMCHSFVTDGRIQFLGDCTHSLAGQTVDIPDCEP